MMDTNKVTRYKVCEETCSQTQRLKADISDGNGNTKLLTECENVNGSLAYQLQELTNENKTGKYSVKN